MDFKINDHVRIKASANLTGKVIDIEEQGDYPYNVKSEDGTSGWYSSGELTLLNKQSNQSDKSPNPSEGVKFDSEKPRYSLLPALALEEVVYVLTFGSQKYADFNWMKVPEADDRFFSAANRHQWQWKRGEKIDSESKRHHLASAITNLMFILEMELMDEKTT